MDYSEPKSINDVEPPNVIGRAANQYTEDDAMKLIEFILGIDGIREHFQNIDAGAIDGKSNPRFHPGLKVSFVEDALGKTRKKLLRSVDGKGWTSNQIAGFLTHIGWNEKPSKPKAPKEKTSNDNATEKSTEEVLFEQRLIELGLSPDPDDNSSAGLLRAKLRTESRNRELLSKRILGMRSELQHLETQVKAKQEAIDAHEEGLSKLEKAIAKIEADMKKKGIKP